MSQSSATKLISKLRYNIRERRNLRNPEGPVGRHKKIKKTVTALLKHERIELNFHRADESRGYAERLISEAIRHGDTHKPTMELASYWIIEPQIVHKLFKVLVPRYRTFTQSYTKMWRAPSIYPGFYFPRCVLELRNNIYPSLEPDKSHYKNLIHNVLLEEARKVYKGKKFYQAAAAEGVEQKEVSGMEAGQPEMIENVQPGVSGMEAGQPEMIENVQPGVSGMEASQPEMKENVQSEVSGMEASQPQMKVNVQSEVAEDCGADSDKVRVADGESGLSSKENLKAVSEGESELKNQVDSSLEADVDLSNIKITDDKPKETISEHEKK